MKKILVLVFVAFCVWVWYDAYGPGAEKAAREKIEREKKETATREARESVSFEQFVLSVSNAHPGEEAKRVGLWKEAALTEVGGLFAILYGTDNFPKSFESLDKRFGGDPAKVLDVLKKWAIRVYYHDYASFAYGRDEVCNEVFRILKDKKPAGMSDEVLYDEIVTWSFVAGLSFVAVEDAMRDSEELKNFHKRHSWEHIYE